MGYYAGPPHEYLDAGDLPAEERPAEEQPGPDKWRLLLGSRKFWAALVGLALVVLKAYKPELPLDAEQVTNLVYLIVAYILGVALEDGLTARGKHAGA